MDKLNAHKILSIIIIAVGFILMALMIYGDSEPGAIPLLLVIIGFAFFFITKRRMRPYRK